MHNKCNYDKALAGEAKAAYKKNKKFREYFHRDYKADQVISNGKKSNPDMDDPSLLEAYIEYLALGGK